MKPATEERGASREVVTGVQVIGHIIRADGTRVRVDAQGNPDERAVLGVWTPPLSYRIGQAVRRFGERLERLWVRG